MRCVGVEGSDGSGVRCSSGSDKDNQHNYSDDDI